MPLDRAVLGNLASEQMERLEERYGDDESVRLGAAIIVLEIITSQGADEQGNERVRSEVTTTANIGDPYRVTGLMEQAKHGLMAADEL